jgi:hypothetical protein
MSAATRARTTGICAIIVFGLSQNSCIRLTMFEQAYQSELCHHGERNFPSRQDPFSCHSGRDAQYVESAFVVSKSHMPLVL